jgi:hypothetical protein
MAWKHAWPSTCVAAIPQQLAAAGKAWLHPLFNPWILRSNRRRNCSRLPIRLLKIGLLFAEGRLGPIFRPIGRSHAEDGPVGPASELPWDLPQRLVQPAATLATAPQAFCPATKPARRHPHSLGFRRPRRRLGQPSGSLRYQRRPVLPLAHTGGHRVQERHPAPDVSQRHQALPRL